MAKKRSHLGQAQEDAKQFVKGAGLLTYVKVDSIEDYFVFVVSKRLSLTVSPKCGMA